MIHAEENRELQKPPSVEPIEAGTKKKETPRPARPRKSGEAREQPSHTRPVDLRENPLQHPRRNTRNRQIRCNKGKRLSTTKRSKLENQFSNSISAIFDAENL